MRSPQPRWTLLFLAHTVSTYSAKHNGREHGCFFIPADLDRPGTTCIAVIAHEWICLRSEVSPSHLILHWVLVLEQPDKTRAWSIDPGLCIIFGNNPCRSPGFQALQKNIQALHSASHLAMSHHQQLPSKGRTRPHSLDIGVYEHQGQREAA